MRRFVPLSLLLVAWMINTHSARADDPAPPPDSRIFTASDYADGTLITDFRTADYSFWVWTSASTEWTLQINPGRIEFHAQPTAGNPKPGWRSLGRLPITLEDLPALSFGDQPGQPVPALFAVSTDPKFDPEPATDLIRGGIKSLAPPTDPRRTTIRTEDRGIEFDPPGSLTAWQNEADKLRDQLRVTLGLWPEPPRTDLHPEVIGTLERDGYAIDRVVLETLPGNFLAGNLFRPTRSPTTNDRHPVVLCPHGHSREGRLDADVQTRCVHLAQMGCMVFLYDMVGYADSKPFGHAWMNDRLKRWGLGLAALQTWNSIRALDYVTGRPDVDPSRVAITGESGGATQTILLTALDPRIKVAVPVVMVSDGYQGGCTCENAPGLRWGTDNVAIAALAAPRPLKIIAATGDWTARAMTNAYPTLQLVYGRYGASDRLSASVFDFPHNYNRTSREAMYPFMGRWLLGLPAITPNQEDDNPHTENGPELLVYSSDHPYPAQALTAETLENTAVERLAGQIDRLGPGADPTVWAATRARLAVAHRVRAPVDPPSPRSTVAKLIRSTERDRFVARHFTVGRVSDGGLIPVVVIEPKQAPVQRGALTILALERGKVELFTATGEPSPQVQALLDRGQQVVGFDPFLIGESVDPSQPTLSRPAAMHFDTYNPSLALDRMRDLATVVSWSQSLDGVTEVNLVARGHVAVLALLARPGLDGLGKTVIDLERFTFGDGSIPVPTGLDLPGLFQFGGLRGAAALVAPAPLWITGAGAEFDPSWPKQAYSLVGGGAFLRMDRNSSPDAVARWVDTGEAGP